MMRNLGGAVGIAMLQTFLTKREQFHSNILMHSVSLFEEATRARIAELTRYFLAHGISDPAAAGRQAVVAIGRTVQTQRSEEHTSELQSLMRISYAVFCLKKKKNN